VGIEFLGNVRSKEGTPDNVFPGTADHTSVFANTAMERAMAMLKRLVCTILLVWAVAGQTASSGKAEDAEPTEHEFVIKNFHTESGSVLPEAHLVYGTIGTLNAAGDNAILLPGYFAGDINGYATFIGHDEALDPSKFFLVITELFGTGRSTSPSNTPSPFDGPRFPVMTIRDNVNATRQLLTKQLHIRHLRAVIGFSMGAQQAFQWAVSQPDFMDRIVATAGTAKTYGHGIVRLEGQIAALTTDSVFAGGNYTSEPEKGIEATSIVWAGWLYSQEWWRKELWKTIEPPGTTFDQVLAESRMMFSGIDANDLLLQMRTWENNNVGDTIPFHGDVEAALRSIKRPVLYMPSETDLYFPITDARYEAAFIPHCTLLPIPSLWGHPAGIGESPADAQFLNEHIAAFLK
jgi:homoserine O-acetyltransferase